MSLPTVAFKEWSQVCAALALGRQSVILRKGGIAEGRSGFVWKHPTFLLFPTHFHEQAQQLRPEGNLPALEPDPSQHTISLVATLEFSTVLTDWEQVLALAPYHFWNEATVQARFDYSGERALSVGVLRVAKLSQPYTFPDAPGYGGCRSWVQVPDAPLQTTVPVLEETTHQQRLATLRTLLSPASPSLHG